MLWRLSIILYILLFHYYEYIVERLLAMHFVSVGTPYEDMFCNDTISFGIGVLGDSAMAHFHIPEEWVWPELLSWDMLAHLPYFIENEFDWPMMSAATGFKNITWPIISGPVYSVYQQLKDRNRCNHRDYQNMGVNGADSHDMLHNQYLLTRSQTNDYPMLLMYALVGNDVCNHYPDTENHMTTTTEMKSNVLHTLQYLDTTLAKGSHVVLMGLADGRFLYNELHKRLHPIGKVNGDVTYPDFYDYFSCLEINPCTGWMSTNETLRNFTSQRAKDLSDVLADVAKSYKSKFKNFDLTFIECPLIPVIKQWEKEHGEGTGWQLIEPVDGFHPNTFGESLSAKYMWNFLQKYLPDLVGEINPHNKEIQDIFGDQGGY